MDLVIDNQTEAVLWAHCRTETQKVDQVRDSVERACPDADAIRYKFVGIGRAIVAEGAV